MRLVQMGTLCPLQSQTEVIFTRLRLKISPTASGGLNRDQWSRGPGVGSVPTGTWSPPRQCPYCPYWSIQTSCVCCGLLEDLPPQ